MGERVKTIKDVVCLGVFSLELHLRRRPDIASVIRLTAIAAPVTDHRSRTNSPPASKAINANKADTKSDTRPKIIAKLAIRVCLVWLVL